MEIMNFSKNLHNLVQVSIQGLKDDFTRYCVFELKNWPDDTLSTENRNLSAYYPDGKNVQKLSIEVGEIQVPQGKILALGKGIFYNEDADLLLFSVRGDTSLYTQKDIYLSVTNVFNVQPSNVKVTVDPHTLEKGSVKSLLKTIYRRIVRLDPRTTRQKKAESFFSQTIEPLLYRAFLKNDWVLLHAAAVEKNGEVFLIFGARNIGKTTVTVNLSQRGWNMIGDDMCLINSSGYILSHPKPIKIENEHLTINNELYDHIHLVRDSFFKIVNPAYRELVKQRGNFEFKVNPKDIGITISSIGQFKKAIFLQRAFLPQKKEPYIEAIDKDKAAHYSQQLVAAEVDVNKRLERDIRYMLALHSDKQIPLSLLTPKACSIISSAFDNKMSYLLTMETPDQRTISLVEKVISQG